MNNELLALVDKAADRDYNDFNTHQNSDENMDYVRGFKAGALFASLKLRTQIYELELKGADKSLESQICATTCL